MIETKRKGAKSIKDIPKDILEQLNHGEIETANLVEWLAVDQRILLENLLEQHDRKKYLKPILTHIDGLKKQTVNTINEAIGTGLFEQTAIHNDSDSFPIISTHQSDFVRAWAAYTIGKNTTLNIKEMLRKIQPFAADRHFGVREVAWFAVRPSIAQYLEESITILSKWTANETKTLDVLQVKRQDLAAFGANISKN